ncbi:uroporphyrinogen-III synthase [Umboniibacter marinipuniceus]|uniref:Uroporphyrinogen-III synthase n=1 Tax=Umboniibacter marinipuniceus TaxID=569599 RepID=A0A3M0ACC5_9GAMM|nr:uroporphyrinogen-III synthase [Umboniibacter marinipuniceus]RMA82206.1 uroporphyrinogen-III synthase [Umboniibacter marinipuniceus]
MVTKPPRLWNTKLTEFSDSARRAVSADWIHEPLFEITKLPLTPQGRTQIMALDEYAGVVFVSQTAIQFALPYFEQFWPQWPTRQHWCAMGKGSAELIRAVDHEVVTATPPTTEGLLTQRALQDVADQRWLIVRGEGGRELLREALQTRGARVEYLELYQRESRAFDIEIQRLINSPLDGIFISSTQALNVVAELFQTKRAQAPTLVVPGERAALKALSLGFRSVIEAASAAENDLVAAWCGAKG